LPVQSGSDRVLGDMDRGHTVDEFRMIVERFRSEIPDISIATDIIVGYPTEEWEDFMDTCSLLEEVKPSFIHLSKYRHRPRARSSSLDEIDFRELRRRSRALEELKMRITEEENRRLVGSFQEILVV
ncbi:MAG TPA: threonylcarbamoyladenosine tRNA methylthiotransferase, partial [Methanothermobacter thermautotrophicus]|nr:threonylcarbamoyladenosine tRNA methylthiotransferase [Methanothermobacter thermautotrophicus]